MTLPLTATPAMVIIIYTPNIGSVGAVNNILLLTPLVQTDSGLVRLLAPQAETGKPSEPCMLDWLCTSAAGAATGNHAATDSTLWGPSPIESYLPNSPWQTSRSTPKAFGSAMKEGS